MRATVAGVAGAVRRHLSNHRGGWLGSVIVLLGAGALAGALLTPATLKEPPDAAFGSKAALVAGASTVIFLAALLFVVVAAEAFRGNLPTEFGSGGIKFERVDEFKNETTATLERLQEQLDGLTQRLAREEAGRRQSLAQPNQLSVEVATLTPSEGGDEDTRRGPGREQ